MAMRGKKGQIPDAFIDFNGQTAHGKVTREEALWVQIRLSIGRIIRHGVQMP
jgi:hypothetical protein